MNEKHTIILTQKEFEQFVYDEIQKQRHILFDIRLEDYFLLPQITERRCKGGVCVSMSKEDWNKHLERLTTTIDDLMVARETIQIMEPVYKAYHKQYESEHAFDLDEHINLVNATYNAEEFERVRDMFEEEFYKQFDDEPER